MKTRPNSATYSSRPLNHSSSFLKERPVSATLPSTTRNRDQFSSLPTFHKNATLSPTHRDVYKKLIIDAVQTINCPILYRTLLKMEKVFQSNSKAKYRFIKMVYLCACNSDQDIDPLVDYLKSQIGVCISLAECRQLILYSGLFGDTSSPTPSKENMKQVVTSMYLHVPQLFYYQKWCRDVKRLETKKHGGNRPTTGYFSSKWKSTGVAGGSLGINSVSDLSGVITNNSDDVSRHSQNSNTQHVDHDHGFAFSDDLNMMSTATKQSLLEDRATSSRHLAMLQAIANGEDEDELAPPPPKPKGINRFKKIALSLVAVGSDLSMSFGETPENGITNHTPFQGNDNKKRKTGQSNVYMLSDAPEYRKLVATLAKGDSTLSPTGGLMHTSSNTKQEDQHDYLSWKTPSSRFDSEADDSTPVGSYGFTPGLNTNTGKNDTSIFNIRGDPIKDGYYVNAASRVEVLNYLDPNYTNPMGQSSRSCSEGTIISTSLSETTPESQSHSIPDTTSAALLDPFEKKLLVTTGKDNPETVVAAPVPPPSDFSPSTIAGSRRFSKSYSQVLLDEDETILREDPKAISTNPFASPLTPTNSFKGNRKSVSKPSQSRISFKSQLSGNENDRKMSILEENDDSYNLPMNKTTKKGNLKHMKSSTSQSSSSHFTTSATVGIAKLRLLQKIKSSKSENKQGLNDSTEQISSTIPPLSTPVNSRSSIIHSNSNNNIMTITTTTSSTNNNSSSNNKELTRKKSNQEATRLSISSMVSKSDQSQKRMFS